MEQCSRQARFKDFSKGRGGGVRFLGKQFFPEKEEEKNTRESCNLVSS